MKLTLGHLIRCFTLLSGSGLIAQGMGCSGEAPTVSGGSISSAGQSVSVPATPTNAPVDSTLIPTPTVSSEPLPPPSATQGNHQPAPKNCGMLICNPGQRCEEDSDAGGSCINNECADLDCKDTDKCSPHKLGGHYCAPDTCKTSVDCDQGDFCDDKGQCTPDACSAHTLSCDGSSVLACDSFGGTQENLYKCMSPAYFESQCVDASVDTTGCSCEDDWDCPAFTACEVGVCKGTGKQPTCSLPPLPFADTPPAVEIHWGGDSIANDAAHDGSPEKKRAPWPKSSHSQSTPMVVNLDDDNGDGLINELDFPEIVFVTYSAGKDNSGIVRAIHGGGPNKGKDMFALCGALLWDEQAPMDTPDDCTYGADSVPSRNTVAVGDLNRDGVPEMVFVTRDRQLVIASNRGQVLYTSAKNLVEQPPQVMGGSLQYGYLPAIAEMDTVGLPEIAVGRQVFVLGTKAGALITENTSPADAGFAVTHVFKGGASSGMPLGSNTGPNPFPSTMGPTSCIADVHENPGQELLAGAALYALPAVTACTTTLPCTGTLTTLWSTVDAMGKVTKDGYCAIADVLGAIGTAAPGPNNPLDGKPEAVLIADGHLVIYNAATGAQLRDVDLAGGALGGAPNIDDFDGDGFPEISSALSDFMVVVDLQEPSQACPEWPTVLERATGANDNPNLPMLARAGGEKCQTNAECGTGTVCNVQQGECVCLHNGWKRKSDDSSSKVTSTSVFDFNGDGRSEVLYNDECSFRVYDGPTGGVLYSEISRSRTALENPVVADVDNDGNAEVVTVMNTEQTGRCIDDLKPGVDTTAMNWDTSGNYNAPLGPNGLRVWGDPQDTWVSARRVWNQFAYHVTNTTEAASIPVLEPESWLPYNDRLYNTYRSQPRNSGTAPDLTVSGISLSFPGVECGKLGDKIDVTFEITNAGDLRVGPGVEVSFLGVWDGMTAPLLKGGMPLTYTLTQSLEPGRSVIATVGFDAMDQNIAELPQSVVVRVDTGGAMGSNFGAERECREDNNERAAMVEPGEPRPDLSIISGTSKANCQTHIATVTLTIKNAGTAPAAGVVVEIFAGDPAAGGTSMATYTVPDPIGAGGEVTVTIEVPKFPLGRSIELYAVVDPNNEIAECNEGDNTTEVGTLRCPIITST